MAKRYFYALVSILLVCTWYSVSGKEYIFKFYFGYEFIESTWLSILFFLSIIIMFTAVIRISKKIFSFSVTIFAIQNLYYIIRFGINGLKYLNSIIPFFIILNCAIIIIFTHKKISSNIYFFCQIIIALSILFFLIYIIHGNITTAKSLEEYISMEEYWKLYIKDFPFLGGTIGQVILWSVFSLIYIRWIQYTENWSGTYKLDFYKLRRFDTMEYNDGRNKSNTNNHKLSGADLYRTMEQLKEINKAMYHDIHFMYIILLIFVILTCIGFAVMIFGAMK